MRFWALRAKQSDVKSWPPISKVHQKRHFHFRFNLQDRSQERNQLATFKAICLRLKHSVTTVCIRGVPKFRFRRQAGEGKITKPRQCRIQGRVLQGQYNAPQHAAEKKDENLTQNKRNLELVPGVNKQQVLNSAKCTRVDTRMFLSMCLITEPPGGHRCQI